MPTPDDYARDTADPEGKAPCDLVLKGGVTSGVVYPLAVAELARTYRFQSIGGTSVGAIAAAAAAAAEYGRRDGGFGRLVALAGELPERLPKLFQPSPPLRPLFGLVMGWQKGRFWPALLGHFGAPALVGMLPGLLLVAVAGLVWHDPWAAVTGAVLALVGATLAVLADLRHLLACELPREAHDFGLCPGLAQPGGEGPGLTEWVTHALDRIAGPGLGGGLLTVADLRSRGIDLRTVTTDISTRRPHALPMQGPDHWFSEAEFRRLFPPRVIDHLLAHCPPAGPLPGEHPGDLRLFRATDGRMPVVVLVRLSLSFPGLISAVPLWRVDQTLATPEVVRCLFSDGGLSSNFPVHFFDTVLPHTPTFGIALDTFDDRREREDQPRKGRIHMPWKPGDGGHLPTHRVQGLGGFLWSLMASAKDWQDSLQSSLPGYRERIVTVALDPDQGGLNLAMPAATIADLAEMGRDAGIEVKTRFDLTRHRWQRYLVELRALDSTLRSFADRLDRPAPDLSYRAMADPAQVAGAPTIPAPPEGLTPGEIRGLGARAARIGAAGQVLRVQVPPLPGPGRLPLSRSRLRNIAEMDD